MGGYSKEYLPEIPNQAAQMPIQEPLKAVIEHHSHNKIKEVVNFVGDTFGWLWLLLIIVIGGIVVLSILFREYIKKKLGTFIKWLDSWINKE